MYCQSLWVRVKMGGSLSRLSGSLKTDLFALRVNIRCVLGSSYRQEQQRPWPSHELAFWIFNLIFLFRVSQFFLIFATINQ